MTRRGVLVVTNERDVDADRLVRGLSVAGVDVVRLNTERVAEWRVELEPGLRWSVARQDRTLCSADCAGVWWRRPEPAPRAQNVTPPEWAAVTEQWLALLRGMQHVEGPRWVSPPAAIRAAEDKALQLTTAATLGFHVPETSWTNDATAAGRHLAAHGGTGVVKSVATAYWEGDRSSRFVFAHAVDEKRLPEGDRLASAPLAFQQRIAPKRDVRVTVIGECAFAAVTDDARADEPDWRLAANPRWRPYEMPEAVRSRCVALVRRLGLRFSGLDLLVDEKDRHWFCELNPNGEWGWLQTAGLPIAEALAEELIA